MNALNSGNAKVTITKGLSGYFAVIVWFNPDGEFWEPWDTGLGRYSCYADAIPEAEFLANDYNIPLTI